MTAARYVILSSYVKDRSLWVLGHDIFKLVAEPFRCRFIRSSIVGYENEVSAPDKT